MLYFISSSSIARLSFQKSSPIFQEQAEKVNEALGGKVEVTPAPGSSSQAKDGTSPANSGAGSLLGSGNVEGKMNATFVTLARNRDVWDIARSIRQVEDRFNHNYHYDWVFLNDKPFDAQFKRVTSALASGRTRYGEIPRAHWSFPDFIDQERAKKTREDMRERKVIYGDSISYRHMCRFESGFFFRQPLLEEYEYYWRVEPGIELFCNIDFDPFRFMVDNNKKYSFTISLYEYIETIPTLWDSIKKFIQAHPEHIAADNSMEFISDDGGDTYNKCHFVRRTLPFLWNSHEERCRRDSFFPSSREPTQEQVR